MTLITDLKSMEMKGGLYKFRPIDKHALDIIVNRRLFLADWQKLNDPHEAMMIVPDRDHAWNYHANPIRLRQLAGQRLKYRLPKARVCSLSKGWSGNLRWSHYADQQRGVAIGIELPSSMPDIEIYEINYDDNVPQVDPPINKESLRKALQHKSTEWQNEDEVRLLTFRKGKEYLDGIIIRDITFGIRTPIEEIKMFAEILRGSTTRFYRMCFKPGKYLMDKSEISAKFGFQ